MPLMFVRTILYWYVKTKYITNQQKVICLCLLFIEMAGQQNTSTILCVKIPKLENCSLFRPCLAYRAWQSPRGGDLYGSWYIQYHSDGVRGILWIGRTYNSRDGMRKNSRGHCDIAVWTTKTISQLWLKNTVIYDIRAFDI